MKRGLRRMTRTEQVEIVGLYGDWVPPFDIGRTVERLLAHVPQEYLVGLSAVVLRTSGDLPRHRRRRKSRHRGRRVYTREALGMYHHEWKGNEACIELYVDNLCEQELDAMLRFRPVRDRLVGGVLFHELGHHIHATLKPEYREREDVANDWSARLVKRYFWRHYWYLEIVDVVIDGCVRLAERMGVRRDHPQ